MSKIFNWLLRIKKEKRKYEGEYAMVVYTKEATENGVFDDFNKEIRIFKDGRLSEIIQYTGESDIKAIRETYQIPVVDLTKDDKEEFKFLDVYPNGLGGSVSIIKS